MLPHPSLNHPQIPNRQFLLTRQPHPFNLNQSHILTNLSQSLLSLCHGQGVIEHCPFLGNLEVVFSKGCVEHALEIRRGGGEVGVEGGEGGSGEEAEGGVAVEEGLAQGEDCRWRGGLYGASLELLEVGQRQWLGNGSSLLLIRLE